MTRLTSSPAKLTTVARNASFLAAFCLMSGCAASPPARSSEPAATSAPAQEATDSEVGAQAEETEGSTKESQDDAVLKNSPGEQASDKKEASEPLSLPDLRREMDEVVDTFETSAESLSCDGALPLREAICAIAERICAMKDPALVNGRTQCDRAKTSCQDAIERFKAKCGTTK